MTEHNLKVNVQNYVVAYPSTPNDKFGDHKVNEKMFKRTPAYNFDLSMFSYEAEDYTLPSDMFCYQRRYDKEYYRSKFPLFDECAYNILEWSSADQLHDLLLRYKFKRKQDKLKQRREEKKKMKEIGKRVNAKKMKKIRKKIILTF